MQNKILLAIASSQTLSYFEPCFRNYNILHCRDVEFLRTSMRQTQNLLTLVELTHLTARHIEAFTNMATQDSPAGLQLNFIFFFHALDNSVYQSFARDRSLLLLGESEKENIVPLTMRFLQGHAVRLRSSERKTVDSPVLVKGSEWTQSREPIAAAGLREALIGATRLSSPAQKGRLLDFSKQGAKVYLPQKSFNAKEYLTLQYRVQNQGPVVVECQSRWERSTADGGQVLGVQFLASL